MFAKASIFFIIGHKVGTIHCKNECALSNQKNQKNTLELSVINQIIP